ncbi:hypothetical protein KKH36_01880 [Patescibacteria group bacterium]|nr:hypothetical protein [Patescibacteria group bacterium]
MISKEKLKWWVYSIFYLLLFVAGVIAVINQNWVNLFLSVLTTLILYFSHRFSKNIGLEFPSEIEIAIIFLIYASLFLGEISSFYSRFWWWDIMLHTFSGVLIALIAFLIVYILNRKTALFMSPFFVSIFAFSFAIALGVIWEIFEFSVDNVFGLNMQKSGLVDTMGDLTLIVVGAFFISFSGYFYLKHKKNNFVSKLINKFLKKNHEYLNGD